MACVSVRSRFFMNFFNDSGCMNFVRPSREPVTINRLAS